MEARRSGRQPQGWPDGSREMSWPQLSIMSGGRQSIPLARTGLWVEAAASSAAMVSARTNSVRLLYLRLHILVSMNIYNCPILL